MSRTSSRPMPTWIIPTAVIAIALVGAIFYFMTTGGTTVRSEGYGTGKNPDLTVSLGTDGVATLGLPGVTKIVDVYEDPLCPFCGEMERKFGQEVAKSIDEGKFAVRYHLMNFLNAASASKDYSTRAIAATQCVAATENGIAYAAFHAKLYSPDIQPKENSDKDYTNAQLAALAQAAGANDEAVNCIKTGANVKLAEAAAAASKASLAAAGGEGTPSVFLSGRALDLQDAQWVVKLEQA
ncbi:MAG: thioredoxin domain-containing protein [Nocardiaceae bacterium]|nr:thioredoxin domain-containing protein [Nocardiaceae bacterium]